MMDSERSSSYSERGTIEVAPLAFMRGRTLNNASSSSTRRQNTTVEQMKMFLTRLGYDSKAVITGDVTQVDLPEGKKRSSTRSPCWAYDEYLNLQVQRRGHHHHLVRRVIRAYDGRDERRREQERRVEDLQGDGHVERRTATGAPRESEDEDDFDPDALARRGPRAHLRWGPRA